MCAAASLATGAAACGGSDEAEPAGSKNAVSIFFMLRSGDGTLAKQGDATYRLSFSPNEEVVAFTDRPDRQANHAPLAQFLAFWKQSDFPGSPPNAALVLTGTDGNVHVVVATLAHPALDEGSGELSFDATLLPDISTGALSVYGPGGSEVPAAFTRGELFVDTVRPPPTFQRSNGEHWP